MFIGRIAHEKNIFYLLDCFKLVVKESPNVKLLIVGSGPQFDEVKEKIKSLSLLENVILVGKVEHKDLVNSGIFGACDIFVTASITENQPMTLLEAQVNGLVSVGVNAKGIPNLIKTKKNGFLVKYGDKEEFAKVTLELINNNKLYNKMRKSTLNLIKKHSLPSVIKTWELTYKELIKKKK